LHFVKIQARASFRFSAPPADDEDEDDADADGQEEFVLSVIVQCDAYLGLDQQYDIPIALTS
jgi:hypothetical protein